MSFIDYIKKFFNKTNTKELPSSNIIETEIIPIKYKNKYGEYFAEFIKEEINNNQDFYKVFLEEYDGICIGDVECDFKNVLKVENDISNLEWRTASNYKLESRVCDLFGESILLKYSENKNCPKFQDIRPSFYNNSSILKNEKVEKIFYQLITTDGWNINYYDKYLCSIKDWKGLKILLESNDYNEFKEKYIDENLFTMLNKAIEIYTDRSEDNFFEKNIDVISKAVDLTKVNLREFSEKYMERVSFVVNNINKEKNKMEEVERLLKEYDSKELNKENNIEIDNNKIIELVDEILNNIDSTENLSKYFKEKIDLGKMIIYNENEKNKTFENLEKIFKSRDKAENSMNKDAHYVVDDDICIIPINNHITDVPKVIHEFIHQYNFNRKSVTYYPEEIPSVYFEKVAINYLINNGFEQYADILENGFTKRKENDASNNVLVINRFVDITKTKKDDGLITMQNILSDDTAKKINFIEHNLYEEKRSIVDTKREYAKSVIRSFANRSGKLNRDIRTFCSYSLGTYFADKYSDDEKMKKRMYELINNPEYTLQNLIDDSKKQEKENKNIKIKQEEYER